MPLVLTCIYAYWKCVRCSHHNRRKRNVNVFAKSAKTLSHIYHLRGFVSEQCLVDAREELTVKEVIYLFDPSTNVPKSY